jgi:hypothetical protein
MKGQLGRLGAHRCAEAFDPPGCVTRSQPPEDIEEEFDARWEHWLDSATDCTPFFHGLEELKKSDLVDALRCSD